MKSLNLQIDIGHKDSIMGIILNKDKYVRYFILNSCGTNMCMQSNGNAEADRRLL